MATLTETVRDLPIPPASTAEAAESDLLWGQHRFAGMAT
jgi:hypothetical protein